MGAARNVVPWKEMERRVAERIAAKAARSVPTWKQAEPASGSGSTDLMEQGLDYDDDDSGPKKRIPAAMESGIRASRPDEAAAIDAGRAMSFTVYKLEDLDARARVSAPPPPPAELPSPWPAVWTSAKALVAGFLAWKKQLVRPKLGDALAVPFATFRADLWIALRAQPWKKIALYGGATVGGFLFLLFLVVTIADITDDVKPTLHVTNEVTATLPAATDDLPFVATPAAPVDPAPAPAIELDDATTTVTAAAAPAPKKPAKHAKKRKTRQPDIFNP